MPDSATEMLNQVRELMPYAEIYWQIAPDSFFTEKPCVLYAQLKTDSKKNGSIRYEKGIHGRSTTQLTKDFVAHIGGRLKTESLKDP